MLRILFTLSLFLGALSSHELSAQSRNEMIDNISNHFDQYNRSHQTQLFQLNENEESHRVVSAAFPLAFMFLYGPEGVAIAAIESTLIELFPAVSSPNATGMSRFMKLVELKETTISQQAFARVLHFNTHGTLNKFEGPALGALYVKNEVGQYRMTQLLWRGTVLTKNEIFAETFLPIFKEALKSGQIIIPSSIQASATWGSVNPTEISKAIFDRLQKYSPTRFELIISQFFYNTFFRAGKAKLASLGKWGAEAPAFFLFEYAWNGTRKILPLLVVGASMAIVYDLLSDKDPSVGIALAALQKQCDVSSENGCAARVLKSLPMSPRTLKSLSLAASGL